MFCTHCGNKYIGNQKFCGFCGRSLILEHDKQTSINHEFKNDYTVQDIGLIKQKELDKINNVIEYFSVQQKVFDDYNSSAESIIKLNRVNAKLSLIWSIILFAISFMGLLRTQTHGYDFDYYLNQFLICAQISGGLLIMFFLLNKRRKTKLENCIKTFCYCGQYLENYYYTYKDCPVGIEYVNPSILNVIREIISSNRAYSIKDALNFLMGSAFQNKKTDFSCLAVEYLVSSHRIHPNTVVFRNINF